MSRYFFKLALFFILIIGIFLRFYKIGQLPTILNRDEAALAYNALLLKETGKDEWGKNWPAALESFGDYKLPGYAIFSLLSFFIFGANDFAVRFSSALAGCVLILLSYFFARRLDFNRYLSLGFSLLIAVSPVFIFYSRMAWEANVALTLLIASLNLLFLEQKKHQNLLINFLAGLMFFIAIFTYNFPYLFLPFIIILIIVKRGLKKIKSWLPIVTFLILIFSFASYILLPLTAQKKGITIFSDETINMNYPAYRQKFEGIFKTIFGNKYCYWGTIIITNFIQNFSFNFLYLKGGNHPWHSLPNVGNIYLITFILGYWGIAVILFKLGKLAFSFFVKNKNDSKKNFLTKVCSLAPRYELPNTLLIYLLIISLIPSIITVDSPHTTRSLFFLYLYCIISLLGLNQLITFSSSFFKKNNFWQKLPLLHLLSGIFIFLVLTESYFYLKKYFFDYPHQQLAFNPGFDQIIKKVENDYPNEKIAIVDASGYQYILTAWYLKTTPKDFFTTIKKQQADKIGFKYGEYLTHYHFIANSDDKTDNEKILIEWKNNQWKIENF